MARVIVTSEDGAVWMRERVTPEEMRSEHFRRCLAERVAWAVDDAQRHDAAEHAEHDTHVYELV